MRRYLPLLLALALPLRGAVLDLTANDSGVTIRGAHRGDPILLLGFQRTVRGYDPVFRRIVRILDADANGETQFVAQEPLRGDVFWVAVDLTSGAFASGVPDGRLARGSDLPAAALIKGPNGEIEDIEADGDHAFLVLVRPGAGAWQGTIGDGSPSDRDGRANGKLKLDVSDLESLSGAEEPPENLADGDVILIVPTHRMTYFAGVVKK